LFPARLTEIDELSRPDHTWLTESDTCYFLGEYTARKGFAHSPTNGLINNFKKTMDKVGRPEWRYKSIAINQAAAALRGAIGDASLQRMTLVPIPPSKARTDPLYDDRVLQMLQRINPAAKLDIREMVLQSCSIEAVHIAASRPTPQELAKLYELQVSLCTPVRDAIAVFDDVLTTGCHFRAMKQVLNLQFPNARVFGIFLARRVPQPPEFVDLDEL
jgi:hypothetical protein